MSTSDICKICKDSASKPSDDGILLCEVNDMLQNMSTDDNSVSVCANCGKEDDKQLKACTACKLVKYCNRECQIAHRPQHKKKCRRRAAELHDEKLFKQPPSQYGDCPICFIQLPSLVSGRRYHSCCGKVICCGCIHAPVYDSHGNKVDNKKCPFCRTPFPESTSNEEIVKRMKKRMQAHDPIAMHSIGCYYSDGTDGYPQDYTKAFELWHRAGKVGHSEAYGCIGNSHNFGRGSEVDIDKKKAKHYWELAAIGGDVNARFNLGNAEVRAGNFDRALKHYMIAAGSGDSESLNFIKKIYAEGNATKDDYTTALRSYQTYFEEIKSVQRDEAAAADEGCRYY